jgi:hypothetical protein
MQSVIPTNPKLLPKKVRHIFGGPKYEGAYCVRGERVAVDPHAKGWE